MKPLAIQTDWLESAAPGSIGLDVVTVGNWIKTGYATGPYQIVDIYGPCFCVEYITSLGDGPQLPSDLHFHLECRDEKGSPAYFAGYTRAGRCVWWSRDIETGKPCFDRLTMVPAPKR